MKKILLAVDDTKGSVQAAKKLSSWAQAFQPEEIVLLHVQRMFGRSLVGEALESDPDLEEVSAALEGTEYLEKLDAASAKIVDYFVTLLNQAGFKNVRPVVTKGHPAEQILATANDEAVDLIVVGSRGRRLHTLLLGSVSREVANTSDISVLVAR